MYEAQIKRTQVVIRWMLAHSHAHTDIYLCEYERASCDNSCKAHYTYFQNAPQPQCPTLTSKFIESSIPERHLGQLQARTLLNSEGLAVYLVTYVSQFVAFRHTTEDWVVIEWDWLIHTRAYVRIWISSQNSEIQCAIKQCTYPHPPPPWAISGPHVCSPMDKPVSHWDYQVFHRMSLEPVSELVKSLHLAATQNTGCLGCFRFPHYNQFEHQIHTVCFELFELDSSWLSSPPLSRRRAPTFILRGLLSHGE